MIGLRTGVAALAAAAAAEATRIPAMMSSIICLHEKGDSFFFIDTFSIYIMHYVKRFASFFLSKPLKEWYNPIQNLTNSGN